MVATHSTVAERGPVDRPPPSLRLSPAKMYERVLAGDPAWNGRFFTGVLTTGIYCLPSCKARKPKLENVRFFPTCEAARQAGLRPCKKCHPDDFARGADPVLEAVETLAAEVRRNPAAFPDTRSVVRRLGFGTTRSFELVRVHYHCTPADLLVRARIDRARALLTAGMETAAPPDDRSPAEVAYAVGFESLSTFHDNFRRLTGLSPAEYRSLRNSLEFEVSLPPAYPLPYLRRALSRDPQSVNERLNGDTYVAAVRLTGGPALLTLQLGECAIHVKIEPCGWTAAPPRGSSTHRISRSSAPRPRATDVPNSPTGASGSTSCGNAPWSEPGVEAHEMVVGLVGLDEDAAGFARLVRKLGLERLIAGRPELRISRIGSVFDALVWSIVGQQINFPFACMLKRRLSELAGTPLAGGLIAPPLPSAVAALRPADLLPLQYSRQKAAYLIGAAQAIERGELDLAALRRLSATRAERTLLALHGLGPWSVNYVMMRSLGFADCVPLGDTGVTSGLQRLFHLDERPDIDATRRLMSVFSPYRSLATAHLWQLEKPPA